MCATSIILSAVATEEPPNFMTTVTWEEDWPGAWRESPLLVVVLEGAEDEDDDDGEEEAAATVEMK
jgi:hypothetical protein